MQYVMTAFAAIVSAVCGAAIGVLFTVAHSASMPIGDVAFPYGIVLGLVCAIGFLAAMRLLWDTRWPAVGGALGLVVAIVVLSFGGPGGSVIVSADWYGWTWLILPAIAALITVVWPRTRRRRHAAGQADPASEDTMDMSEQPAEEYP